MNKYTFTDLLIGQKETFTVYITDADMEAFRKITHDVNPLHNDDMYAQRKGYKERVVYGMLTSAYLSTLAGVYLPGEHSLIQNVQIDMAKPVYVGQCLDITGEVVDKSEAFNILKLKFSMINEDGEKVLRGTMRIGVRE